MKIGFTGTREGMTINQLVTLDDLLRDIGGTVPVFHHGCCVGADFEAQAMAHNLGFHVVCHPPLDKKLMAQVDGHAWLPPKPYLERNRDIVDACVLLIATPKENKPDIPVDPTNLYTGGTWATVRYALKVGTGGTWATVRYALKFGKPYTIIWPDGSTS